MMKMYFCTSIVFKKQMLQAANTGLFSPLIPNAHNSECQNLLFPLQIKPVKDFYTIIGFLFFDLRH